MSGRGKARNVKPRVRHVNGTTQGRKSRYAKRHKPCDMRWISLLEGALSAGAIDLTALEYMTHEAGYEMDYDGNWREIVA